MASSLEEHYLQILGNPEVGNLVELEKKFKRKSAEYLVTKTAGRVDISLIQKSGELTSAYLYLKGKWEINSKDKPFVPQILRIVNPKEEPLSFLEKLHKNLQSISMASLFALALISLYQFGSLLLDTNFANGFSKNRDYEALANLIVEEDKVRNDMGAMAAENIKQSRKTFEQKLEQKSMSPILIAARSCNLMQIDKEINSGANINFIDSDGASPLHWTARINCVRGSEILIKAGANINITDHTGKTPLSWAKVSNNHETIRLLEKAGALK